MKKQVALFLSMVLFLGLNVAHASSVTIGGQEKVSSKSISLENDEQFILTFGPYDVEYFADRMKIKAARVGLGKMYSKRSYKNFDGRQMYRADIGPFSSKDEALKGWKKLKEIVKDLPEPEFKK